MSTKRKGVLDDEVLRLESQLHQVQRDKEELRDKLQECVDINLKLEKSRNELGEMVNTRLNILYTCTHYKPVAPGAVVGTCPFFSGDVASTFGCKRHGL